jgi:hypothetical protein
VGVVVEGVLLASGKNRMRVAAAGFADTLELKRIGADWQDANRGRVEIEFLMPNDCARSYQDTETPHLEVQAIGFADAN